MADNHTQQPFVPLRPSEDAPAGGFPAPSYETQDAVHGESNNVEPRVVSSHPQAATVPRGEGMPEERARLSTSGVRPVQRRPNLGSRLFDAVSGHRKEQEPVHYQGPMPGGLGQTLRAYREALGYTPQDISDRIKFPHQSISALEDEDWSALQEGFLLRALVRQYAEVVQLDPDKAVELLTLSRGVQEEEPHMRYRASSQSAKAIYGTVYADEQAAAQAAAKSIPYNVHRDNDDLIDSVVGEAVPSAAPVDEPEEELEPVDVPAPVFQGGVETTSSAKARLQACLDWAQDRQNAGMLVGGLVAFLLLLVIIYLLFTN